MGDGGVGVEDGGKFKGFLGVLQRFQAAFLLQNKPNSIGILLGLFVSPTPSQIGFAHVDAIGDFAIGCPILPLVIIDAILANFSQARLLGLGAVVRAGASCEQYAADCNKQNVFHDYSSFA